MLPGMRDTICLQCAFLKNCGRYDICLRQHAVAATGPSPFKVGDNQRPEQTMSGVRKPLPESSGPGENLPRGSRRNQLRRGHGSPPVLSEVPHELSTDAHSKECKRSPQQFIPTGFPPHDNLQPGTEDSAIPLTTPDMVRPGRVLQTSVKSNLRPSSPDNPPQTVHKCRNRGKAPIRQCRTTDDGGCTRFPSPCSGIPNIRIHREYAPYKR